MQDKSGFFILKNNNVGRRSLSLLHAVLHVNTDTDRDAAIVADALQLIIGIIQLPLAGLEMYEKLSDVVDLALGCLYHLTASTEGRQQALQLLGVASIEDLMRAALTWLEDDSCTEDQWIVAAREAFLPPWHAQKLT